MILTVGDVDTRDLRWGKYDCPMAVYLESQLMDGWSDDVSGNVEAPTGHFARFGKWILTSDNYGFVSAYKYPSKEAAEISFGRLNDQYCKWDSDDEEDEGGDEL